MPQYQALWFDGRLLMFQAETRKHNGCVSGVDDIPVSFSRTPAGQHTLTILIPRMLSLYVMLNDGGDRNIAAGDVRSPHWFSATPSVVALFTAYRDSYADFLCNEQLLHFRDGYRHRWRASTLLAFCQQRTGAGDWYAVHPVGTYGSFEGTTLHAIVDNRRPANSTRRFKFLVCTH